MASDTIVLTLVGLGALGLFSLAFWLGWRGRAGLALIGALLLALPFVTFVLISLGKPAIEGLPYSAIAFVYFAPALVALLLGVMAGAWVRWLGRAGGTR